MRLARRCSFCSCHSKVVVAFQSSKMTQFSLKIHCSFHNSLIKSHNIYIYSQKRVISIYKYIPRRERYTLLVSTKHHVHMYKHANTP